MHPTESSAPETNKDLPNWYQSALDIPNEQGETIVEGCKINFVSWGNPENPGLILLHGSNAHLEWWRFVAPFLSDDFHVVALDSSGSGNSGWREKYDSATFAKEVMAVAKATGMEKPYVAGHSFGGYLALETGHLYSAELGGTIMLDFTVQSKEMVDEFLVYRQEVQKTPSRPTRVYPDKLTTLKRFRLVPEQNCENQFLVDYLAQHSIREVDDGWTWKFDPNMYRRLDTEVSTEIASSEKLLGLKCPSAFVMAEDSTDYSAESLAYTKEITNKGISFLQVPGTHHHLMMDDPLAVAMAMKGVLIAWHNL